MYFNFFFVKKPTSLLSILFFLAIAHFDAFSQNQRVLDSLTTDLNSSSGLKRCDILFELGRQHINWDNSGSLTFVEEGIKLAESLGDSLRIVRGGRLRGQVLRRMDRVPESIQSLSEVLNIAERNKDDKDIYKEYKFILGGLAIAYTYNADYDRALEFNYKSLLIRETEGDKGEISIVLNNIGLVYFKLKNYKSAHEYYHKALAMKKESKDDYDMDRLLINIGLCYNQLKQFKEAQKYFKEAFVICGENCSGDKKIEGRFGLGVSYYNEERYDEALNEFQESFKIAKETDNKRFQGENQVYIGKIFIRKGEAQSATQALRMSEEVASKSGYNELLIDTYRQFSILFGKIKDYENAAVYQSKYITLKDSVYSEQLIDNIAKIQTNYAERVNLATIAAKELVIQQQRSLNTAIVVIAVLASLLIFVLYRSNQVKKKVNAALSEAKGIIEDQNKQLLNSNFNLDRELKEKNVDLEKANESLRRVNEELDNFIYKTSHDIRGPLASLKGMCNVALMDVKDTLALNYLKKLDITAEKLNTILTRLLIVNQINNSTLGNERIDFNNIVSDVLMLEKKKGLPPRLKITRNIDDNILYHSDKEFVRIILENLIDNAIKFYNDSERVEPFVNITVREESNAVKITVVDNGIGISEVHPDKIFQMFSRASERSETGGIGLYITKTATEKLGGSVNLKTTPEGYTEFFVRLPLQSVKVMA
ncbi:MAG: tetratricopeptide repeat protein [Bacteroidota bacterium]